MFFLLCLVCFAWLALLAAFCWVCSAERNFVRGYGGRLLTDPVCLMLDLSLFMFYDSLLFVCHFWCIVSQLFMFDCVCLFHLALFDKQFMTNASFLVYHFICRVFFPNLSFPKLYVLCLNSQLSCFTLHLSCLVCDFYSSFPICNCPCLVSHLICLASHLSFHMYHVWFLLFMSHESFHMSRVSCLICHFSFPKQPYNTQNQKHKDPQKHADNSKNHEIHEIKEITKIWVIHKIQKIQKSIESRKSNK